MKHPRLADLAGRYAVPEAGRAALECFLELLAEDDDAPTAVRDPTVAVDTHVADALSGLDIPELEAAKVVADIGAGAGVPGLVLAAARPEMQVTAVESVGRKCTFIQGAIERMGLGNASVVNDRAETWTEGFAACDAVTARAVAPLPVLVEYAAPLLRMGGALVAWKAGVGAGEEADGDAAAHLLGLDLPRRVPVTPFPGVRDRSLYVYLKVRSTPNEYPRRPGMARKRPIRAST